MDQDRRTTTDPMQEALLISLDQLSQTLEVMGNVVNRLRYQVEGLTNTHNKSTCERQLTHTH
ncbi:hypothetical protein [Simiduia aestuariiviva]|uniref:Uncharacterized protein n=1 Tax=Simiduia aestuariiviva TaxID=1510459 RepID=A0A839UJ43_9GAMM|nr:hypothetical protein [Simiduia aestuariiviva]MBB3167573.1 hypothetical protein [Simiduia aestuariiviva]